MATVRDVLTYLRNHPIDPARKEPDFLAVDETRRMWYVRWPNGTLRWETEPSLIDRGFPPPAQPVVP